MNKNVIGSNFAKLSASNSDLDIILRAENITKVFLGTVALDQVNYNVYRGRVNALVGENGAGKSTLMKILAGVEQKTKGKIIMDAKEIHLRSPLDAVRCGIGIIYQELDLCLNMSVVDNIFLAREVVHNGKIDRRFEKQRTRELLQRLEQKIDPDTIVGDLRVSEQQLVAITKALVQDVRILIMDEPTSSLNVNEVEVLFRVIHELKCSGISIIYISHRLNEVMQISDCITVLRDGHVVAEEATENIDIHWVVEKMIGRKEAAFFKCKEHKIGEVLLRVENLTLPSITGSYLVNHVSFEVRAGEILGIYGLKGAGRSELLECLAGVYPWATGKIWLAGKELRTNEVIKRIQEGLVLVPEDRQRDGLVQTLSVAHNMLLASLDKYLDWLQLFLVKKKEKKAVDALIKDLSIRVADSQNLITSLSGGNQQKVVVAKGLLTSPKVLMLDEPTRGIDVGAKSEIFGIIERLATQGYGILFVSSELKEIINISDRIIVMSEGSITGEFMRGEVTEVELINLSGISKKLENKSKKNERQK